MLKKCLAVAILTSALCWPGIAVAQNHQLLPTRLGAARMPEPVPVGRLKKLPPLKPGPITPFDAPPGPSDDLSLPAGHTSAFQLEHYDEGYPLGENFSYFTVDLMVLRPVLSDNPAFSTTLPIESVSTSGAVHFSEFPVEVFPRFNFNLQFSPLWSVRASYYQFDTESNNISFQNANPNRQITSVNPFPEGTVLSQTSVTRSLQGLGNTPSGTVNRILPVAGGFQVSSPETYFFLPFTETQTIDDATPDPLPPFPFTSSVSAGFTDNLFFRNEFQMKVADIEATRYIELGPTYGSLSVGARYAHLSHLYVAQRINDGGTNFVPGYDPFNNLDDDANIIVRTDRRNLLYGYDYHGGGPKAMFNLNMLLPQGPGRTRLFSNFGGAVLFGSRKERLHLTGTTDVQIADIDRIPDSDIFYNQTIDTRLERNDFHVLPMTEFELGISVRFGPGELGPVINAGMNLQYLFGAGNSTDPEANLLLFGGYVSAGITF